MSKNINQLHPVALSQYLYLTAPRAHEKNIENKRLVLQKRGESQPKKEKGEKTEKPLISRQECEGAELQK